MGKKFGRNKAGHITSNETVTMIVSILAVTLFIGTAIQSVIAAPAAPLSSGGAEVEEVEEECIPCKAEELEQWDPKCKTCVGAVFHSVKYMKDHVKATMKDKDVYFLWTVDVSIVIFEGLILGLEDSGFKIVINYEDLFQYINNSVNKLVNPTNYLFPVTKCLAILIAIPIGITVYLLTLCNGD